MARAVGGPLGGSMLSTEYGKGHATLGLEPRLDIDCSRAVPSPGPSSPPNLNPHHTLSPPPWFPHCTSNPTPTNPDLSSPLCPPVPRPVLTNLSASTDICSLQWVQELQEERSDFAEAVSRDI